MAAHAAANQQKQFDDFNRVAMIQRLQAARPQIGMVILNEIWKYSIFELFLKLFKGASVVIGTCSTCPPTHDETWNDIQSSTSFNE